MRIWYVYFVSFIKHHILLESNLCTRRSARVTFWSNIAARTIHCRSLFDCSLSCIRCWKANMAIVVGGKIMPYSRVLNNRKTRFEQFLFLLDKTKWWYSNTYLMIIFLKFVLPTFILLNYYLQSLTCEKNSILLSILWEKLINYIWRK